MAAARVNGIRIRACFGRVKNPNRIVAESERKECILVHSAQKYLVVTRAVCMWNTSLPEFAEVIVRTALFATARRRASAPTLVAALAACRRKMTAAVASVAAASSDFNWRSSV